MKFISFLFAALIFGHTGFSQIAQNVTLLDNWDNDTLPLDGYGATFNECWGFTYNGAEYAVMGSTVGTHLFMISATDQLVEIQFIPGSITNAIHRDYHDYNNYLYGVSDEDPGLDIMDMSTLPDSLTRVNKTNQLFLTHNIFIDSATATLYACDGAITDIYSIVQPDSLEPISPFVFPSSDYVHDIYARNDTLFMNCSNSGLTFIDLGDPTPLTHTFDFYPEEGYNHSGWLADNGTTYVFADETPGKSVKVCDFSDWTDPQITALIRPNTFDSTTAHNLMIKEDLLYISYYYDGLQIYDISDIYNPIRVAYYDTYQGPDSTNFEGAWGVYCFLPSERILVSDRHNGLFLLRLDLPSGIQEEDRTVRIETQFDSFTLRFRDQFQKNVRVFSIAGQLVFEATFSKDHILIDNQKWKSGNYVFTVTGKAGTAKGKLFKAP
jgi:choice-of-anchor B domain-containing protein